MTTPRSDAEELRSLLSPVPGWARVVIATVGVATVATGAWAVFRTENGTGSAALVAAGLALVFLAVLVERLESLEAAGLKLQLRKAAAEVEAEDKDRAADAADQAGRSSEAERLRAEAEVLRGKAQVVGAAYEGLRSRMPSSWERTAQIDRLLKDAARDVPSVDADSLRALFASGRDGDRVFALTLMQEHPREADAQAIADAVLSPRSAMEQWHAIRAAERFTAVSADLQAVAKVKDAIRTGVVVGMISPDDRDRYKAAHRVLGVKPGSVEV